MLRRLKDFLFCLMLQKLSSTCLLPYGFLPSFTARMVSSADLYSLVMESTVLRIQRTFISIFILTKSKDEVIHQFSKISKSKFLNLNF